MERQKIPNFISGCDEIQPIDGYVEMLLENAVKKYNVKIDLENPTRSQRLEAALALQNEANGWNSIEIMAGRRVDASEPAAQDYSFLTMAQAMSPQDPRKFYEGFAHIYWPEEKKANTKNKK